MQRRTRWAVVLGSAAVAGVVLLAVLSMGHSVVPRAAADTPTGTSTGTATSTTTTTATSTMTATSTATTVACTVTGITANPTAGQTGVATTFTATTTGCTAAQTAGGIFVWFFGDGATGTGNPTTHAYTTANTYNVVVQASGTVTGTSSLSYTVAQSLTVSAGGPYTGGVGQAITFTGSGTGLPSDATFSWNFGDGQSGTGQTVTHVYTTSGTYTVTLTVSSASLGRSGTATTTATIGSTSAPTLTITGPSTAQPGQSVTYSVSTSGATAPSDYTFTWNFGDGTATVTGASVTHTFASAGTFTVTVTGTSTSSPSSNASASMTTTVSQAPSGPQVTYGPGWNIVGGPSGTTFAQAAGPLYTYQANDSVYESMPATSGITAGLGYWAFFNQTTTVTLNGSGGTSFSVNAPASHWIMIGNPSGTATLRVTGADVIYRFDPTANNYVQVSTLAPGQGAWVISLNGGTISLAP